MSLDHEQISVSSAIAPATATFMRALEKLFRAGCYYPVDHERTRALTTEFRAAMVEILSGANKLTFEVKDETLHLQGDAIPDGVQGAVGFLALLEPLAVVRLSLDETITHENLHALVSLLPQLQQQLLDNRLDERFAFTGLPMGVTIEQREFVVNTIEDENESAWNELRERILSAVKELEGRGLESESVAMIRHLMRGFGARVASSLSRRDEISAESMLDGLSVDLEIENIETAPTHDETIADVEQTLDQLVDLLERSMLSEGGERTREVFQQMVGILNRSVPAAWRTGQALVKEHSEKNNEEYKMSVAELGGVLDAAKPVEQAFHVPDQSDRREIISVIGWLLGRDVSPSVLHWINRELGIVLSEGLHESERAILVQAAGAVFQNEMSPLQVAGFANLVRTFRESSTESVLELLMEIGLICPDRSRSRLWPHAVNEVLLNAPDEDPDVTITAREWLSPIPESDLDEALGVLVTLDAIAEDRASKDLIRFLPKALDAVFAAILRGTTDNSISTELIEALHERPPCWIGACVLPLIRNDGEDHRDFYSLILDGCESKGDPDYVKSLAADLITARLLSLPRHRRSESWVRSTILAMGSLTNRKTESMLQKIRTQRVFLIIPAWPKECRSTAKTVHEQLKQKRKG